MAPRGKIGSGSDLQALDDAGVCYHVDERKQEAMHLVCRCVYYSRLYSLCYNRAHERERLQRQIGRAHV